MDPQDEREILIQLAELRQAMTSIISSVDEVKSSVKEVITLDRTIAELSIYHQQQSKEIQTQWARIDAQTTALDAVDKKADEWINKGRGAWATLMIVGTLAQAAVLGSVAYTFNHLRAAEDAVLLLNQRVIQLEKNK